MCHENGSQAEHQPFSLQKGGGGGVRKSQVTPHYSQPLCNISTGRFTFRQLGRESCLSSLTSDLHKSKLYRLNCFVGLLGDVVRNNWPFQFGDILSGEKDGVL